MAEGRHRRKLLARTCTKCWRPFTLVLMGRQVVCKSCGHVRATLLAGGWSTEPVIDLRPLESRPGT